MSNTMGGVESRIGKGVQGSLNQSSGASSGAAGGGGATHRDLADRLAEMKAKLQALKKH